MEPRKKTHHESIWVTPGYVLYGVGEERQASTSGPAVTTDDNEQTINSGDANRPPQGIAMMKEDIADVALLIRKGTPVTIILNREDTSRS